MDQIIHVSFELWFCIVFIFKNENLKREYIRMYASLSDEDKLYNKIKHFVDFSGNKEMTLPLDEIKINAKLSTKRKTNETQYYKSLYSMDS
jgi:ABC-type siderophore export system fused ATPase/permease subunit